MNLTQWGECAWSRLHGATQAELRSVKHYFDRRQLEAGIASLIDAAAGHELQGLAPGAPLYQVLHREAELLVTGYCNRWQISPEQVQAELPALSKLRRLAQPAPPRQKVMSKAVAVILVTLVLSLMLGLAGAFIRLGYLLGGGGR